MGKPAFNAQSLQHVERHKLYPEELIVNETLNVRRKPHTLADVKERAIDMLLHKQLAPILIRKAHDQGGKPLVVAGFLRTKAALWINEHVFPKGGIEIDTPGGKKFIPVTERFKIEAAGFIGNDADAVIANMIENLSRKETTVMDFTKGVQMLLNQNLTETEIAQRLHCPLERVHRATKLLSLPNDLQDMIDEGVLTVDSGLALLAAPAEDRKAAIEAAKADAQKRGVMLERSDTAFLMHTPGEETDHDEFVGAAAAGNGGKKAGKKGKGKKRAALSGGVIRKTLRERKHASGKKGSGLTRAEIRSYHQSFTDDTAPEGLSPEEKDFHKKVLAWIDGEITSKQMTNAERKFGNVELVTA